MVTRDDLIKAGTQALLRDGLEGWSMLGARQMAERVVDAVEPPIRADEYGKCAARLDDMDYFMVNTRTKTLADLHTKVEALQKGYDSENSQDAIDDVLALIDGAQ